MRELRRSQEWIVLFSLIVAGSRATPFLYF